MRKLGPEQSLINSKINSNQIPLSKANCCLMPRIAMEKCSLTPPPEMEKSLSDLSIATQTLPRAKINIDQVLALLKSKDDTRRFVGLTLLMSSLDIIKADENLVSECWDAIPRSFLTALLRAKVISNLHRTQNQEDAEAKFSLGVTVLHAFLSLVPMHCMTQRSSKMDERTEKMWSLRLDALIEGVDLSPGPLKLEIIQVLCSIAGVQGGAMLLYLQPLERWSLLLKKLPEYPTVLEVVRLTIDGVFMHSGTPNLALSKGSNMDNLLCMVLRNINEDVLIHSSFFKWFDYLSESLSTILGSGSGKSVDYEQFTFMDELAKFIIIFIRNSGHRISEHHRSIIKLAHDWVFRTTQFKIALFGISAPRLSKTVKSSEGSTPPSFVFITALLVDVRSTIPSLQEVLYKPEYSEISIRLANSYDLIFAYLDFILAEEQDEIAADTIRNQPSSTLPYDLVFSLQESITQLMHLTVEFLRDRFDSIATIVHTSNALTTGSAEITPTALEQMAADPLIISQVGALGFWLNDEDSASADNLLEPLIQLCICENQSDNLYARTLQAMLRDRSDLQQEAEMLVESLAISPAVRETLSSILGSG